MKQSINQEGGIIKIILIIVAVCFTLLVIGIAFLFGFGVKEWNKLSVGETVTETRDVSDFSNIQLNGFGNLIIEQGSQEALEIETGNNLMKYIKTEVKGDTLVIEYKKAWLVGLMMLKNHDETNFNLSVKDLDNISLSGSGDIVTEDFETTDLSIDISGSGDVDMNIQAKQLDSNVSGSGEFDLTGEVVNQSITISGSGKYRAFDLASQVAEVEISGSGEIELDVDDALDVSISGTGDVKYTGNPSITQSITGSGDISQVK
ncbi:MAG: head GIN domain-containing protein [bacterium]|nr:head GIN domain-containing protein [bacterium]